MKKIVIMSIFEDSIYWIFTDSLPPWTKFKHDVKTQTFTEKG